METDGTNYTLVVNHSLGEIWSKFLERWITTAMMGSLGISPSIETSEKAVMFKFAKK